MEKNKNTFSKKTCKMKKKKKKLLMRMEHVTVRAVQKVMSCMAFVFVFGVCAWDLYHVFLDFVFARNSWIFWGVPFVCTIDPSTITVASTPREHKPVPATGPGKRHAIVTATQTPTSLSASGNPTTCSVHCYLSPLFDLRGRTNERTHSCIGRSQHRAHSHPQSLTQLLITSHALTSGALEPHSHHLCCRHTPPRLLLLLLLVQWPFTP